MDMLHGFYQVGLSPESREYAAFITQSGTYSLNRLPFGLKNAPATFSPILMSIMRRLIDSVCQLYMDDILVLGQDEVSHLEKLRVCLDRLRKYGLKIKLCKCTFFQTKVTYLGHVITQGGILPDPKKVNALLDMKPPTSVKELQCFLGMTGWFCRFIPRYSETAKPLTSLLKKGINFEWTDKPKILLLL